jgi:hypothetical protein
MTGDLAVGFVNMYELHATQRTSSVGARRPPASQCPIIHIQKTMRRMDLDLEKKGRSAMERPF